MSSQASSTASRSSTYEHAEKIIAVVQETLATLCRGSPFPDRLCEFHESGDVRVAIHSILRAFACFSDNDRYVPCHPGSHADACRKGYMCPYVIGYLIFQWAMAKVSQMDDYEIKLGLSGCNFLHEVRDVNAVRALVHAHLDEFCGEVDATSATPLVDGGASVVGAEVRRAMDNVSNYLYWSVYPRGYAVKNIPVFSLAQGKKVRADIYLSDDNIFFDGKMLLSMPRKVEAMDTESASASSGETFPELPTESTETVHTPNSPTIIDVSGDTYLSELIEKHGVMATA